jgi:FtsZ-binding cell division protein ZapB
VKQYAIQELSKQSDKLRMEVCSLQTQNHDLNADNQRIMSRHIFDFMQALVNSLRNEILGLASISAYVTFSIGLQFEYPEKLKSDHCNEFASLSRAYKGEEGVTIQEIKTRLIKATEVAKSRLEANDRLTEVLSRG